MTILLKIHPDDRREELTLERDYERDIVVVRAHDVSGGLDATVTVDVKDMRDAVRMLGLDS